MAERPRKQIDIPVVALTRARTGHTPSADHPWRRFHCSKKVTNYVVRVNKKGVKEKVKTVK